MSSQKLNTPGRFLVIGSAALLLQIGGVAVASQHPDIQAQMREVLSGHIQARQTPHAQAGRDEQSSRSGADAQAFARRLLQGWSASVVAGAPRTNEHPAAAHPRKYADVQALVRRQLLGV